MTRWQMDNKLINRPLATFFGFVEIATSMMELGVHISHHCVHEIK
jgi:hypothetical protein